MSASRLCAGCLAGSEDLDGCILCRAQRVVSLSGEGIAASAGGSVRMPSEPGLDGAMSASLSLVLVERCFATCESIHNSERMKNASSIIAEHRAYRATAPDLAG